MSEMENQIQQLCQHAKRASRQLATASTAQKNELLQVIANDLNAQRDAIRDVNQKDLEAGKERGLSSALLDRLELNKKRIDGMIEGIENVIRLEDPVGKIEKEWALPNELKMQKVRVPIGVIGIIYESRPNVTIDAAALCLKTGNVTVLRGGKEAFESNRFLSEVMQKAAEKVGFDRYVTTMIPTTEREAIPVFCHQNETVDLMIPRGGHGLIKTVVEHARMPVIKHYTGVCQVYVHEKADSKMAEEIAVNAKCQRPGVCNAMETLLIDESISKSFVPQVVKALEAKGVQIFGDEQVGNCLGREVQAPEHWSMEYLDLILSIRVVKGVKEAVSHINEYGSHHSDSIVTEDEAVAEQFLNEVDSAAVYWNASTRFTDGAEFGFGAEIGISTDKIHARGPMALEELTSYKYLARGKGQIK